MTEAIVNTAVIAFSSLRAAGLLAAAILTGGGALLEGAVGYWESRSWTSPDTALVAHATNIVEVGSARLASRSFLETPNGNRVVVTRILDAPSGSTEYTLQDDESSWSTSVTRTIATRAATLDEFFAATPKRSVYEDDPEEVVVRLGGKTIYRGKARPLDLQNWQEGWRQLGGSVADVRRAERGELPASVRDGCDFIRAHLLLSTKPDDSFVADLVAMAWFIEGAYAPHDTPPREYAAGKWVRDSTRDMRGRDFLITNKSLVDFLSDFKSVRQPTEPLADTGVK